MIDGPLAVHVLIDGHVARTFSSCDIAARRTLCFFGMRQGGNAVDEPRRGDLDDLCLEDCIVSTSLSDRPAVMRGAAMLALIQNREADTCTPLPSSLLRY